MSNALSIRGCTYVSPWETLSIQGVDAVDLLNRLLTLDTKRLEINQGSWAFLLDHRGQVREAMWLIKASAQHFLAISETGADSLAESLDMFIFSEDVALTHLKDYVCLYLSERSEQSSVVEDLEGWFSAPISLFYFSDERRADGSQKVTEQLCVGPRADLSSLKLASISDEGFNRYRIHLGGALPSREYRSGTPLDVGRIGVSEGKGCYPGQEVIERTIALGKPSQFTISASLNFSSISTLKRFNDLTEGTNDETLFPLYEGGQEGTTPREIGAITSLITPSDHEESFPNGVQAIIKLKSRFTHFTAPLHCEIYLGDDREVIALSLSRR